MWPENPGETGILSANCLAPDGAHRWASSAILSAIIGRQVVSQWKSGATSSVSKWLFVGQIKGTPLQHTNPRSFRLVALMPGVACPTSCKTRKAGLL